MLGTLVKIIADSMNELFDDSTHRSSPSSMIEQMRDDLRSVISDSFGSEGPLFETDFGINFDFENTENSVFKFSQDDEFN